MKNSKIQDSIKASQSGPADGTIGKKYDGGKAEYGLLPANILHEVVLVLTKGAEKYSRDNWKYVEDGERRYFDAAQRHQWALKRGEKLDPEDNLHHIAHAICDLMFLYEITNK